MAARAPSRAAGRAPAAGKPISTSALVLLALSPMVRPPVQDARQHAALAAALLIGAQLLLGYWFYSYLTWCYPLLIIAIIQARPGHEAAGTSAHGATTPIDLAAPARANPASPWEILHVRISALRQYRQT